MPRLIDYVLATSAGYTPAGVDPADPTYQTIRKASCAILRSKPIVIVIDNAYEYVMSRIRSGERFHILDDCPNVAPPFQAFWMEYRCRSAGSHPMATLERGALFMAVKNPDDDWAARVVMYTRNRSHHIIGPECDVLVKIDTSGQVVDGRLYPLWMPPFGAAMRDGAPADPTALLPSELAPFFFAISLMHCKNAKMEDRTPPESAQSEWQKGKQKKRPLVRYKVLEIEPMRRILDGEGEAREKGLKHALHICRGHFKDYRQSGLFGKLPGIYWWDQHIRGDKKQGLVLKDYAVSPAKD